jgi:hypothetical protein
MRFRINESTVSSGFANVMFGDNIVGSSTPSKDKINQDLLKDVSDAAKKVGIEVTITTAVSGHKRGTRHETGNAVDIAIVNGKGFSSESDAKKKEIHDDIVKFVDALVSMGYKKNSEKGFDKAVLTFGFKNHNHHVHVSRKAIGNSKPKISDNKDDEDDEVTIDKMTKDLNIPDNTKLSFSDISGSSTMKKKGIPLKNDKYFIIHHTAGRGTPQDVMSILNKRGLGIQWIIDRDGKLYKSLPTASFGQHVSPNKSSAPKDLSNKTSQGVEIIASNDDDILPQQCRTALKLVKMLGYPTSSLYGHGELQTNKEATEGKTCKDYIIKNYNIIPSNLKVSSDDEKNSSNLSSDNTQNVQPKSSDSQPKTFQDVMSYPEELRKEKYKEWLLQNINLFENKGLKKRSSKINKELDRIKNLF